MATDRTAEASSQRLSRERILDAALELVEAGGLESLSMRRLAQALDVWPMSIYRYFQDKDELLDAVAGSAAEAVALPRAGESWRSQISALLRDARRVLGADPAGLATRLPRAILSPGLLRVSEAGLAILEDAGFSKQEAASAWRALLSYTFGFAMLSVAPAEAEARRRARTALAALPDDRFPSLAAARDELADALSGEDEFDRGLERLLDGLAAASQSSNVA